MMRALLSEGKQEEAFNYSERARSRGFLEHLGQQGATVQGQERVARGRKGITGADCGNQGETLRRGGSRNRQVGFKEAACRGRGGLQRFSFQG